MPISYANTPKSVVSAWIALEVLSPPAFKEPQDLVGGDKRAVARLTDRSLPWEKMSEPAGQSTQLYYQLILGTLNLESATAQLTAAYPESSAESRTARGHAVMAVLILDSRGRLVKDNAASISSFAWGLPRALAGQLESLSEWPSAEKTLTQELLARLRQTSDEGEAMPLTVASLKQSFDWLVHTLGLPAEGVQGPRFALRMDERGAAPEPAN